jgi:hypothetical protein
MQELAEEQVWALFPALQPDGWAPRAPVDWDQLPTVTLICGRCLRRNRRVLDVLRVPPSPVWPPERLSADPRARPSVRKTWPEPFILAEDEPVPEPPPGGPGRRVWRCHPKRCGATWSRTVDQVYEALHRAVAAGRREIVVGPDL